jgi:hypothetical protein
MNSDLFPSGKEEDLQPLSSGLLARAVKLFLSFAYRGGEVPASKEVFLRWSEEDALADCLSQKGVERPKESSPASNVRYAIRLGNAWYPHMKLLIAIMEPSGEVLFSVDTHDRLEVPPGSPDEAGVKELQSRNRDLAREIEVAWDEGGIPTQAGLLRRYLQTKKGDSTTASP